MVQHPPNIQTVMMEIIIIEDVVYKVSDREYKKLREMSEAVKRAEYPMSENLSDDLNDYLDDNKSKYQEVGVIMFDYRR